MAGHSDHPFAKTANSLRATVTRSVEASSEPPQADDTAEPKYGDPISRIEAAQREVVSAVSDSLDVVGEVVDELRESVAEDERVRKEVRELGGRLRRLERLVRIAVVACCGLVLLASLVSLVTSFTNWRRVEGIEQNIGRLSVIVEDVDKATARTLKAVLKNAEAHAKSVEAEVALTPQADREALEAAIDAQEEVAEAQIDVAEQRREAPPPAARRALKEARAKRARLNDPPPLLSLPEAQSAPKVQSDVKSPSPFATHPTKQIAPRK